MTAAPTSRVGVIETWAMGRAARDEYLQFRSLSSRTTLHVDERLAYADAMQLEPGVSDVANAGVLAGRRYVAAGFWHGATLAAEARRRAIRWRHAGRLRAVHARHRLPARAR